MTPHHSKLLARAQELDRLGKVEEASVAYREFLALEPRQAHVWSDYAGKLLMLGRLEEAEKACGSALRIDPRELAAQINLGFILMRRGQLEGAEAHFRQALVSDPKRLDAGLALAECLLKKGDLDGVWKVLEKGHQQGHGGRFSGLKAQHAEIWAAFAGDLLEVKRYAEAEKACGKALQLDPHHLSSKINRACILMGLGQLDEAEGQFRRVSAEHPRRTDARLALAECLGRKGDLKAQEREVWEVIQQEPANLTAHQMLGGIFYSQGRWEDFQAEIERLRGIDPASPYLEFEQGFLDLLFGEMPRGWERYEARWRVPGLVKPLREFPQPTWRGEPFAGKTLLLYAEQGFGDTLMFLRYAPMVKALGGRVVVEVQRSLLDLSATCRGVDEVIPFGDPLPPFDLQVSLLSLPAIFRTDLSSIPLEIPYLDVPVRVPNRQVISDLLALAQAHGRARVGLVWAGNPTHKRDAERSLPAAALAPLAALPGLAWFSLQVGHAELPPLPDLISLAPLLSNFSDTAYALSGMDLVITVDTSVAHLAGALGIPTLLLLSFQPDFRWMLDRADSPWYPTLRLYRQEGLGAWDAVIQRLVHDLPQCLDEVRNLERPVRRMPEVEPVGPEDRAVAVLRERLVREAGNPVLWADLAGHLLRLARLPEAEEACRRALGLEPDHVQAQINLGLVHLEQGRLEDSETCFRRVLALEPGRNDVRMALSECLFKGGDLDKAYLNLSELLQGNSGSPQVEYERGLLDLLFGKMAPGWKGFEARLKIPEQGLARNFPQPSWDGAPFPGKTILLHCEQGFGDTLMLLRYVPRVKALGGRVLLVVQPPLVALAGTCGGADEVISLGSPLPPFDLFLSLFSLPGVFGTGLDSIPAEIPYLDIPVSIPHRMDIARALATSEGKVRVGLVWSGNSAYKNNTARSIPCAALESLASLGGVAWYSFQVGTPEMPGIPGISSLAPFLGDFSDTAYGLSGMDLLISVDTAVVHLAGALGIPTLLLVPFFPDWRWLLGRDDSPWYPTVRIYRQPEPGDWGSVLRQVVADLTVES